MGSQAVYRYLDPGAEAALRRQPAPRRALFLDRDGVINVDYGYVHRPEQVSWIPGIFELCGQALARGYLPVVVTNQAGVARGLYSEEEFLAFTRWIHERFAREGAPLLATYYCPHHPTAGLGALLQACECRKPKPGMLLAAARDLDLDPRASLLIGDTDSDLAAARAAGVPDAWKFTGGALPSFDRLLAEAAMPRMEPVEPGRSGQRADRNDKNEQEQD